MNKKSGKFGLTLLLVLMLTAMLAGTALANPVSGAVSTTDNPGYVGPDTYTNQACLNGNGVNCNIYLDKRDVWFSGLPNQAALGAGNYFFAVLVPGGQGGHDNPNDGTPNNLSDVAPTTNTPGGDAWENRTFSVDSNGIIAYSGTHEFDQNNNKLQMFPYDDTTNPGGVYILAVCSLDGTLNPDKFGQPGVDPRDCKYDAFKVKKGDVEGLSVVKDATGSYDLEYAWSIQKAALAPTTAWKDAGLPATFNYTVTVSHDGGTVKNVDVSGTITVLNPNQDDVVGDLTDTINDPNATCEVNGGNDTGLVFPPGASYWAYDCIYTAAPQSNTEVNTVTVSWAEQELQKSNGTLAAGSDTFSFEFTFAVNLLDNCATVSDDLFGSLGQVCVGDAGDSNGTFIFNYSLQFIAPAAGTCQSFVNTASFADNSNPQQTGSSSATVTVCSWKGRLTPGYWKNHLAYDSKNPTNPWTAKYLPLFLGNYKVDTTAKATAVWNVMNCSSTKDQDAVGCLGGHLLAAKLNVANGSNTCISTRIGNADAFLISINYTGPSAKYALSASQRSYIITLKTALDQYNNGGYCH